MGRAWQEEGEKQRGMKERGGEAGQRRHGGERTREEAETTKKWRQAGGLERERERVGEGRRM